jgi:SPP1 gp7 family putative phage head morphogenesis protein
MTLPDFTPATLSAIAQAHRKALLHRDAQTSAAMVRLYSSTAQRIEQRILQLAQQIDEATTRGEHVSPSWLFQQERLQTLLTQVQNEIGRFSSAAGLMVENVQREFALAGMTNAEDLITLSRDNVTRFRGAASPADADAARVRVGFSQLATDAVESFAGFAADGSPLAELFAQLGPAAAQEIKQTLIAGIVQGLGAKQLARQVRNSLGGNMARALLISRNETLRAYREGSQRFYEANDDVVRGWLWVAACNQRTCPVCWAMHGSVHPVSEQFVSHPGCRCTQAPITDLSRGVATGGARFAQLNEDQQKQILGPKKFDAYQDGKISLKSLAGMRDDGRWGKTRAERNLQDAIEATQASTPLPVGPMRHVPSQPAPAPPDEPLEVLLPVVEKQLPAATAVEARQRVINVHSQYEGMLSGIDDELKQLRNTINWQYMPATSGRARELLKLRAEVASARTERMLDILSVAQPTTFNVKMKPTDKARKAVWQLGLEQFKKLVGVDLSGKTVMFKGAGRRRSFQSGDSVNLATDAPTSTVVHELGHWLEEKSAEVHRKTIDFLERRTAGEKPISLRKHTGMTGYRSNELARPDKFMSPYVGKDYRHPFMDLAVATGQRTIYDQIHATEVVSMGLQWYVEQPAEFARKGP